MHHKTNKSKNKSIYNFRFMSNTFFQECSYFLWLKCDSPLENRVTIIEIVDIEFFSQFIYTYMHRRIQFLRRFPKYKIKWSTNADKTFNSFYRINKFGLDEQRINKCLNNFKKFNLLLL